MLASDFVGVFNSIEKLQNGLEYQDDSRDGAWLLYDNDRKSFVIMGITGYALFWEEVDLIGADTSAPAGVLRCKLEEDSQSDKESRCFPCRIRREDAMSLVNMVKNRGKFIRSSSLRNMNIFLEDFKHDANEVTLTLFGTGIKRAQCVATAGYAVSMEENIYNYFVKRSGPFAPMNTHGAEFMIDPFYAKLCMDLLVSRAGTKHKHKAVRVTQYGMINDGDRHKSIAANHLEINAYDPDSSDYNALPIRGVLLMFTHPGGIDGRPWYPLPADQD